MRRVALLVGNSTFAPDSTISDLRFPPADVSAMSSLLGDPEIGRYDRVISLIEKRSDEILIALNQMLDEERGASILFYYSGHGKPSDDGRLYLAAQHHTTSPSSNGSTVCLDIANERGLWTEPLRHHS